MALTMGTRRDIDSGKRDTLGRRIKVSSLFGRKRAQEQAPLSVRENVLRIADEFTDATNRAAHYAVMGDKEKFDEALEESHKLYALYQHLDYLTDDIPTKRKKFAQWRDNYQKFVRDHNIDDPRVPINTSRVKASKTQENQVNDTIKQVVLEASQIVGSTEEVDKYVKRIESMRNTPRSTKEQRKPHPKNYHTTDKRGHEVPEKLYEEQNNFFSSYAPVDVNLEKLKKEERHKNAQTVSNDAVYDQRGMTYDDYMRARKNARKNGKRPRAKLPKNQGFFRNVEDRTGLSDYGAFRVTYRPRVGPFTFNLGRRGLSSISLGAGPVRYMIWGRTHGPGLSSIDLPSGFSFRGKKRKKRW